MPPSLLHASSRQAIAAAGAVLCPATQLGNGRDFAASGTLDPPAAARCSKEEDKALLFCELQRRGFLLFYRWGGGGG